ncbi:MAG TPA: hypothetical protein VFO66_04985 [Gemmatimonadaceae bacterium]|nr:hypothetical protein [Gemmatimonadaceae bacterium]
MSDAAAAASTAPRAPLRQLLRGVVDYAGLFPPAGLPMAGAVEQYARHRQEPSAWMLGRFVLPAARLDEFEAAAAAHLPRESASWWSLSALLSSDIEEDLARVERFNDRHRDARHGAALVDTVELKAHSVQDVAHAAGVVQRQFDTYMEIPVAEDPAELVAAIGTARAKAKIRTGGTTADAFPPTAQVIRFIARCIAHGVPFKATAGLHHPWRGEYRLTYEPDADRGHMFGFLNVLLATAALHAGAGEQEAAAILDERHPDAVEIGGDSVRVGGRTIAPDALLRARDSMTSFGSCSFAEPVGDLRAQGLL